MSNQLSKSYFTLNISYDEFLRVYEGSARFVQTTSFDGRSIRFPANILRQFLTHKGISGLFVIRYDANNKFQGIEKIG